MFLQDIKAVAHLLDIKPVIFQGQQLKDAGFGGQYLFSQRLKTNNIEAIIITLLPPRKYTLHNVSN